MIKLIVSYEAESDKWNLRLSENTTKKKIVRRTNKFERYTVKGCK